jgi:type IV secretion system protein VirB10
MSAARFHLVDNVDPRSEPANDSAPDDSAEALLPAVASTRPSRGPWLIIGVAALLAIVVLVWLSLRRADQAAGVAPEDALPAASGAVSAAPPPPSDLLMAEAAGRGPLYPAVPGQQTGPTLIAPPNTVATGAPPADAGAFPQTSFAPSPYFNPQPGVAPAPAPAADPLQRRRAPLLVVDLAPASAGAQAGGAADPLPQAGRAGGPALASGAGALEAAGALGAIAAAGGAAAGSSGLNGDEQFAERVGSLEPERARATMLRNPHLVVPQGATITAVMETALNSDLPGFARAVVSRDVRAFDGKTVLIPRGSRVIGQYRSGVAVGQSRAFVIWTRVLRPDGASVQIASSGADTLGRAGLPGEVDRHFFRRFGGSALLSVINGATAALTGRPSTQIVIGSSQQAAGLASVAAPANASPTIKVPQGTPVRIFVARDLDFSTVQGAG